MAVKPIPDGFHSVTPELNVKGVAQLIDFMKQVFGAEEIMRMPGPGGAIMHAEVRIGDSVLMLADAVRDAPVPGSNFVYVNDVDATYRKALQAGATSVVEPADMFWGDRFSRVKDASGNFWSIATHKEDVPPAEMPKRAAEFMKQQSS